MSDFPNLKLLLLLFLSMLLVSCSHGKRISNLEYNIQDIENKLSRLEKGLLNNQSKIREDLSRLYSETESEFNHINQMTEEIKNKTDKELLTNKSTHSEAQW